MVIFEDKIKLAFLKVFSGVKTLNRHKGVTIKKLIPIISRLKFNIEDIATIIDNIDTVLKNEMFKSVSQEYWQ